MSTDDQALVLAAALELAEAGCSVIPVSDDGTKRPGLPAWATFMDAPADAELVRSWFDPAPHVGGRAPFGGVGIVCGAVSGNLVMVEAEAAATAELPELAALAHASGLGELWQRAWDGWLEVSPSGGVHVLVRCTEPVAGNVKLARGADGRATLAETRGEGGYVVAAPTPGRYHHAGAPWVRLGGGPRTAAVLTGAELAAYLDLWRTLDRAPAPLSAPATLGGASAPAGAAAAFLAGHEAGEAAGAGEAGEVSPGDDYEARTDWSELLGPAGWSLVHRTGRTRYWRRPGKGDGVSATTGRAEDRDRLYVFSSSTEFPTETPLTKFGAYALVHHGGDYSAAARELRRLGYGSERPKRKAASPERNAELAAAARAARGERHLAVVSGEGGEAGAATARVADARADTRAVPRKHNTRLTDSGNALMLSEQHGHRLRYVPERAQWLIWNAPGAPGRWMSDASGTTVLELMRTTIEQAEELGEDADGREHRARSLGRRPLADAVTIARGLPGIIVPASRLDADPYVLGTPSGLVDLRTGTLRPATPDALVTKAAAVVPDAGCPTPRWRTFLARMFGPSPEVLGYVQRLLGYACSGLSSYHVLPFLHGPGANGKSVLAGVARRLLGEYASAAPAGFLMAGLQQHSTELAMLEGIRFLVASEIDQRARFDEAKVKLLTGGDAITARAMRQDFRTFMPTHKLWLLGNHLPRVEVGGESFWRRLRLIDCGEVVPAAERIPDLDQLLVESEGPGILAWMVAGFVDLVARGDLGEPASVMADTQTYAAEESGFDAFAGERLHVGGGPAARVESGVMRAAYAAWCQDEGMEPLSPTALGRELVRIGVPRKPSGGRKYYTNVALVTETPMGAGWGEL